VDTALEQFADLDGRLVDAAKDIKVLSQLAWPAHVGAEFLASWHAGDPRLPAVEPPRVRFDSNIRALASIMRECDRDHPVGRYLYRTARSYKLAAAMIEQAGTPEFTVVLAPMDGEAGFAIVVGDAGGGLDGGGGVAAGVGGQPVVA
jgi:hypothetical protein